MSRERDRDRGRPVFRVVHGFTAWVGIAAGLPLAALGGMALVGTLTANGWARALVPVAALLVAPALLADRLLPSDPDKRRPGLVRDVLSGSWMAAALATVVLANGLLGAPLRAEAQRLEDSERPRAAWLSRWLAGPPEVMLAEATAGPETADPETADPETIDPVELPATEVDADPPADAAATVTGPAEGDPDPAPDSGEVAAKGEREPDPAEAAPADPEPEPGPEPGEDPRYSPAELFESYAPAVVALTVQGPYGRSSGTGFFIDANGTLATNHHVIADAKEIEVKLYDGTRVDSVELLVSDAEVDLALLRIDPSGLEAPVQVATLGDSQTVEVGEPVSVIGNPLGLDHTLTTGIVSARRVYEGERYIQMSAPISPGNSGGPVFDTRGRVIGVSVAGLIGGQNLNLAVPISQLSDMIAADDRYPERRTFGSKSW